MIRLNRRLFSALWNHLKARPAVRRALAVNLNPTLQHNGDRWVYLAKVAGREVFQRLAQSEALELVLAMIRRNSETTLGHISDSMARNPQLDATLDSATAYLDALIDRGALTFRAPVGEQDPDWPEPLRELLAPIEDDHAQAVATLLPRLRTLAGLLELSPAEQRVGVVSEILVAMKETEEATGISFGALHQLIYYEDATADALVAIRQSPDADRTFAALLRLVVATQALAYPRALEATMRQFFASRFGDRPSVPLLEFYECFYREHFKNHQEKEARLRRADQDESLRGFDAQNPFKLPYVASLHSAGARVTALFRAAWRETPGAEEVDVSAQSMADIITDLSTPTGLYSSAFFCHGLTRSPRDGSVRVVMPNAHHSVGFGKFFSRFLHLLPPDFTNDVRVANKALSEEMVAEICGDGDFNADLHPALLPYSIADPTAEVESRATLTAVDLDVTPDEIDFHRLRLVHRQSGTTVFPVDLGFRNPMMRPPLFQLLSYFAPCGAFAIHLPETLYESAIADVTKEVGTSTESPKVDTGGVLYRPRMTYDSRIVLARRRWTVASTYFPGRLAGESAADYFVRINEWRIGHGIPDEVFARLDLQRRMADPPPLAEKPLTEETEEKFEPQAKVDPDLEAPENPELAAHARNGKRQARYSRDWRKPQYIDFRSPMLVNLFGRLVLPRGEYRVHLEERFPEESDLPECDGERYAAEYVFQISSPTISVSPSSAAGS